MRVITDYWKSNYIYWKKDYQFVKLPFEKLDCFKFGSSYCSYLQIIIFRGYSTLNNRITARKNLYGKSNRLLGRFMLVMFVLNRICKKLFPIGAFHGINLLLSMDFPSFFSRGFVKKISVAGKRFSFCK